MQKYVSRQLFSILFLSTRCRDTILNCVHYLYSITNTVNTKVYIGQTVQPVRRWHDHKRDASKPEASMRVHKAMAKHGIANFSFLVIASCQTEAEADDLETLLVTQYDSYGNGYNSTTGGKAGYRPGKATGPRKQDKSLFIRVDQNLLDEIAAVMKENPLLNRSAVLRECLLIGLESKRIRKKKITRV